MLLINFKAELKLKWTKCCVLAVAGGNKTNANLNNIIFTIKDTKLYVPVAIFIVKGNQKLPKLLSNVFEKSVYWNEYKTKSENENTANKYNYFFKPNFVGVN